MAIFAVASFDATGLDSMLLGGTGATGAKAYIFRPLSNRISITNNSQNGFADFDTTIAAQTLISLTRTGTDVRIKVNEIDSTQTERATQGLDFTVYRIGGAFNNAYSLDGRIQAVILYNADKSSDRADIETALNDYFNVY